MTREQRTSIAMEYFKRLDTGADLFELFADNADVSFPVGQLFTQIRHHYEEFNIIVEDEMVVVEGTPGQA